MDRAHYQGWRFYRHRPGPGNAAEGVGHAGPMITTSTFTFANPYRPSTRYAKGLLDLSAAVAALLPAFTLRVYCDSSIDPGRLEAQQGRGEEARAWRDTLTLLASSPHVNVVWFEYPAFAAPSAAAAGAGGGGGHVDLFGTFARFFPLFDTAGCGLPAWASSPPNGVPVFSSDVDFGDFATERVMMAALAWWSAQQPQPQPQPHSTTLLGIAAAGSAAARHCPASPLPPLYSGLLATRTRFPMAWLDDFLADAQRQATGGASHLLSRYIAAIHDPASQRTPVYGKRRVEGQRLFPFGVDEFFLTNVVRTRVVAGEGVCNWLFLVLPTVDAEVSKALGLIGGYAAATTAAAAAAPAPAPAPAADHLHHQHHLTAVIRGCARAAGLPREEEEGLDFASFNPQWQKEWPGAAAATLRLWSKHTGEATYPVFSEGHSKRVAGGLKSAMGGLVQLMASGALAHTGEDLEQALQNLTYLSSTPHLSTTRAFRVGGGQICLDPSGGEGASLLAFLHAPPEALTRALVMGRGGGGGGGAGGAGGAGGPFTLGFSPPPLEQQQQGGGGVKRKREEGGHTWSTPPQTFPGWESRVSRSSGLYYFFSASTNKSVWHDPTLPAPWAWERDNDTSPKVYVNLETGERRRGAPPPPPPPPAPTTA